MATQHHTTAASIGADPKGSSSDIADQSGSSSTLPSHHSDDPKSISQDNQDNVSVDKYKIPSSVIVLNEEDKKRLEYVLLQINLRDVGLG